MFAVFLHTKVFRSEAINDYAGGDWKYVMIFSLLYLSFELKESGVAVVM